jgi:hypothetical protein
MTTIMLILLNKGPCQRSSLAVSRSMNRRRTTSHNHENKKPPETGGLQGVGQFDVDQAYAGHAPESRRDTA